MVYNDFHIGEGAEIEIIAGCGIHNCGCDDSVHEGIHRFFLGKNSKVVYIEKHIGEGDGSGKRIINPQTHVEAEENAYIEMDTVQLKGVDSTKRVSSAKLGPGATIVIKEKIMTHGHQTAETSFDVSLDGAGSSAKLISRSVARDFSRQLFRSKIIGNTDCYGHSECDAIIMDNGVVAAEPEIIANHVDASLVHEAAIGKIAGDGQFEHYCEKRGHQLGKNNSSGGGAGRAGQFLPHCKCGGADRLHGKYHHGRRPHPCTQNLLLV